jgi:hypothetical protein
MGTSSSPDEFAAKMRAAAFAIGFAEADGMRRAGLDVTTLLRGVVARMSGGDRRLSGVGASGARVGARFTQKGATVHVRATGPLHLVEHDTGAHAIYPKRKRAVAYGGKVRAHTSHPGTKGKKQWTQARKRDVPKITREALMAEAVKRLGRVF